MGLSLMHAPKMVSMDRDGLFILQELLALGSTMAGISETQSKNMASSFHGTDTHMSRACIPSTGLLALTTVATSHFFDNQSNIF